MKTRAAAKSLHRRKLLRPFFDTLEDRLPLGDAILGSALGLTALGSALLRSGQAPEMAIVGDPGSLPGGQAEDAPAGGGYVPTFTVSSEVAPLPFWGNPSGGDNASGGPADQPFDNAGGATTSLSGLPASSSANGTPSGNGPAGSGSSNSAASSAAQAAAVS